MGYNRYWNSAALVSRHVPVKDRTSKNIQAAQTGREEPFLKDTQSWEVREGERIWEDLGDEFDQNTLYKTLNELKKKIKTYWRK